MKTTALILIMCMLAGASSEIQAQNLKRFVTNKSGTAGEAAGERVDKETDTIVAKGVNVGIDKLKGKFFGTSGSSTQSGQESGTDGGDNNSGAGNSTGSSGSKGKSSSSGNLLGKSLMGAMGMSGNVKMKELYEFNTYVQMEVKNYDSIGDLTQSGKYDSYNSTESLDYALVFHENNDMSTIIFDTENQVMLTLSESGDEKTGFAISLASDSTYAEAETNEAEVAEDTETDPYKQYRTGKTKTILGYKCDEYLMDDDYNEAHMWLTTEINKDLQKDVMRNAIFGGLFLYAGYMNGMVMEYDILEKGSGERVVMTVTDLDLQKKQTISTRGYSVFSMGAPPSE